MSTWKQETRGTEDYWEVISMTTHSSQTPDYGADCLTRRKEQGHHYGKRKHVIGKEQDGGNRGTGLPGGSCKLLAI